MELHEKYDLTEEQLESVVSVLTFLYTNWQKAETELEWRVVEFTDEDSNANWTSHNIMLKSVEAIFETIKDNSSGKLKSVLSKGFFEAVKEFDIEEEYLHEQMRLSNEFAISRYLNS